MIDHSLDFTQAGFSLGYFLSLVSYVIFVNITPGPNNIMLTASGMNYGFKKTVPHILGVAIGCLLLFSLVALGLGNIFLAYPVLHTALKIIGSVYLLWLAYKIYTSGNANFDDGKAEPITFIQAMAFQFVNPKAWTMAITTVSAFSLPGDYLWFSLVAVVLVEFLLIFPCVSLWVVAGSRLKFVMQSPQQSKIFNRVLGVLTAACVVVIFS